MLARVLIIIGKENLAVIPLSIGKSQQIAPALAQSCSSTAQSTHLRAKLGAGSLETTPKVLGSG